MLGDKPNLRRRELMPTVRTNHGRDKRSSRHEKAFNQRRVAANIASRWSKKSVHGDSVLGGTAGGAGGIPGGAAGGCAFGGEGGDVFGGAFGGAFGGVCGGVFGGAVGAVASPPTPTPVVGFVPPITALPGTTDRSSTRIMKRAPIGSPRNNVSTPIEISKPC
jgi:hypothetical protein